MLERDDPDPVPGAGEFQGRDWLERERDLAFRELNENRGGRASWESDAPVLSDHDQGRLRGTGFEQTSSTLPDHTASDPGSAKSPAEYPVEHLRVDPSTLPASKRKSAIRSLVPYELSLDVCEAMEAFDGHVREHEPAVRQDTLNV